MVPGTRVLLAAALSAACGEGARSDEATTALLGLAPEAGAPPSAAADMDGGVTRVNRTVSGEGGELSRGGASGRDELGKMPERYVDLFREFFLQVTGGGQTMNVTTWVGVMQLILPIVTGPEATPSEKELRDMFTRYDEDKDGNMKFEEFLLHLETQLKAAMARLIIGTIEKVPKGLHDGVTKQQMRDVEKFDWDPAADKAFDYGDVDKDGRLKGANEIGRVVDFSLVQWEEMETKLTKVFRKFAELPSHKLEMVMEHLGKDPETLSEGALTAVKTDLNEDLDFADFVELMAKQDEMDNIRAAVTKQLEAKGTVSGKVLKEGLERIVLANVKAKMTKLFAECGSDGETCLDKAAFDCVAQRFSGWPMAFQSA